jgi:cyanophycin synthetase
MTQNNIEFLRVSHLRGPNIWTYRPIIEAWVDIGDLEDSPSNTIPGFYERLITWLPGLIEHRCGVGEPGGFMLRVREGTWPAHILEHITIELQNLAGMQTGFGKARQTPVRGVYKVAVRARDGNVSRAAISSARDLVMAAIEDRPFDVATAVEELRELVEKYCLGPSTACIINAATERGIPSIRLNDGNLVQLGHGDRQRRIWTAETDKTSAIAESIASDKDLTKFLLGSCGVPVPAGRLVDSAAEAWEAAEDIGLPVVVKPVDGNHGRGISLELTTQAEVHAAYPFALRHGSSVLVERFVAGNEHRLLVVSGKVVAASRGESAWVTGDGKLTILELVEIQINSDPRRGLTEDAPLNRLRIEDDTAIRLELERQDFGPHSIPDVGRRVLIQRNGNVAFDCTDEVHPEVAAIVGLAARVIGLDVAGIDLVAEDISRPLDVQGAAVVEVNAGPGLLMHLKPASGKPRPVGLAIVNHLFPNDEDGRIPIIGICGHQSGSQAARLIALLMRISGWHVGLACADGLFLGSRRVDSGDPTRFDDAQRLLMNRSVDSAVFESTAEGILRDGLPYDKCHIGIVTGVGGGDKLGEFYLNDDDQVFNVLRTQVDVILPSGTAVLNAADPRVVEMAELCDGSVIFYGMSFELTALGAHRAKGGRAAFMRNGEVILATGNEEVVLSALSSELLSSGVIPVDTILAAVSTAWALDIPQVLIAAGLETFTAEQSLHMAVS